MFYYDETDKNSIYNYAKQLEGKTFNTICDEDDIFISKQNKFTAREDYKSDHGHKSRKGGLGEIIEERFFHYSADNDSRADFHKANLELKVTPFKINKNGTYSAKERLIISMINYMDIVNMDFYSSNAWEKIENILLVYYLWEEDVEDRLDYIIKFVSLFSPNSTDLKIIEEDFNLIKQKVIEGKAHELSEGDTLYLGAATKGATSKDRRIQPFSEKLAKPRAFSLKNSYMTYVLRNYIIDLDTKSDKVIKEDSKIVLKDIGFEEYVLNKINKYKNNTASDLFKMCFPNDSGYSKDKLSRIIYEILEIRTKSAEEFEKANIVVKTIRVNLNDKIIESMSFPTFTIKNLIKQEWEESDIYNLFNETKFLFVIFKEFKHGEYKLSGGKFWNMPVSDIENTLRSEWEDVVEVFNKGVKFKIKSNRILNNLPKKSETEILHVRPHARKSAYLINGVKYGNGQLERDTDDLPNGDKMTKQCFWLNNDYILKQIKKIM